MFCKQRRFVIEKSQPRRMVIVEGLVFSNFADLFVRRSYESRPFILLVYECPLINAAIAARTQTDDWLNRGLESWSCSCPCRKGGGEHWFFGTLWNVG
jgi:hypothetical protein